MGAVGMAQCRSGQRTPQPPARLPGQPSARASVAAGDGTSTSRSAAAQQAIAVHWIRPSGSPWINAPEIIATTGTKMDDRPATVVGNRPTIVNQATLPMAIGTSVM